MSVLKYLKEVYCGKDAIFNHIAIFSLIGIMTISLNTYVSYISGNMFSNFLGFAPSNHVVLGANLVTALMLVIFFTGYCFEIIKNFFENCNGIPDVSLSAYRTFVKMLPVLIVWGIYISFAVAVGGLLIPFDSKLFHIYFALLLCSLPFVNIIYIIFARNFKFNGALLNPFTLFRILDKTVGKVIELTIQTVILLLIPALAVYTIFYFAGVTKDIVYQLGLRLCGGCMFVYFLFILKFVYLLGLTDIVKEKFNDIQ